MIIVHAQLQSHCTGANAKGIHLKSLVGVHIFAKRTPPPPPPIKILGTALIIDL